MIVRQLASIYYTMDPDNDEAAVLGIINVPLEDVSEKLVSIAREGGELFDVEFKDHYKADTSTVDHTMVLGETVETYRPLIDKVAYPNG